MTAAAAAAAIREVDANGAVGMVCGEPHTPYDRPPLSKALWKDASEDDIWRDLDASGIETTLGQRIAGIDLSARTAVDESGASYGFEKLLLATGAAPRRLGVPGDDAVIYFRTLDDYRRLRRLAEERKRFLVVGGSFIGSEIAAALAMNDREVSMVFPAEAVCANLFPSDLADSVTARYRDEGVDVRAGERVVALERKGDRIAVTTKALDGESRSSLVDVVVAGVGVVPRTELAEATGLPVDDGISVDEQLRAGRSEVFAAGDGASFPSAVLERRMRVEHEDNANAMGARAGRNMAGESAPYTHVPLFYSDLFDLGYEAVGLVDSGLDVVADWKEPFKEGVLYYLEDGRVRGVLLWNVWERVDAARELLAERSRRRPEDLKGRIA